MPWSLSRPWNQRLKLGWPSHWRCPLCTRCWHSMAGALAPYKSHLQADLAAREAWKKTPERLIDEVGSFCGPAPAATNVSGQSIFRPHQRCAALLGQAIPSSHCTCLTDATIPCADGAIRPLDGRCRLAQKPGHEIGREYANLVSATLLARTQSAGTCVG